MAFVVLASGIDPGRTPTVGHRTADDTADDTAGDTRRRQGEMPMPAQFVRHVTGHHPGLDALSASGRERRPLIWDGAR
ncbi:hypothetical protein [Microbispora hainanensis]|uniref:Uncharacterized protein n=1 Tax=Microbispora hainanensis TaxID=568844 RepID=A0A544YZQ2_9ACTN|nr:hypothetical protein [Microbispora hainanensis]TQS21902.1 hypothetical protein FLX08_09955 [Microbispora hainanensis]